MTDTHNIDGTVNTAPSSFSSLIADSHRRHQGPGSNSFTMFKAMQWFLAIFMYARPSVRGLWLRTLRMLISVAAWLGLLMLAGGAIFNYTALGIPATITSGSILEFHNFILMLCALFLGCRGALLTWFAFTFMTSGFPSDIPAFLLANKGILVFYFLAGLPTWTRDLSLVITLIWSTALLALYHPLVNGVLQSVLQVYVANPWPVLFYAVEGLLLAILATIAHRIYYSK